MNVVCSLLVVNFISCSLWLSSSCRFVVVFVDSEWIVVLVVCLRCMMFCSPSVFLLRLRVGRPLCRLVHIWTGGSVLWYNIWAAITRILGKVCVSMYLCCVMFDVLGISLAYKIKFYYFHSKGYIKKILERANILLYANQLHMCDSSSRPEWPSRSNWGTSVASLDNRYA